MLPSPLFRSHARYRLVCAQSKSLRPLRFAAMGSGSVDPLDADHLHYSTLGTKHHPTPRSPNLRNKIPCSHIMLSTNRLLHTHGVVLEELSASVERGDAVVHDVHSPLPLGGAVYESDCFCMRPNVVFVDPKYDAH